MDFDATHVKAKPRAVGLLLAIRARRLGCSPLRPRRMYEEPQADRILRSLSSSRKLFERSDEGATGVLSQGRKGEQARFPMAPKGAEGDVTARSSPTACGFALTRKKNASVRSRRVDPAGKVDAAHERCLDFNLT